MKSLLEKIKDQIDNADIISFDIFDTLLTRPYIRPTDLFLHLEKIYQQPFFCDARQEAEKQARQNHPELEDITFDMIYNELDDKFQYLKDKELDLEKTVLQINPEMLDVYKYAIKTNKKIIITSDMYLPSDFLKIILINQKISKWNNIYISGEQNKSKATGTLFQQILKDYLETKPDKILHIGDNFISNNINPQKFGIKTYLYQPILQQFLKQNKRAGKYLKQNIFSLGRSIFVSIIAQHWFKQQYFHNDLNYWENLGYLYAGPTAYAYCRFIEQQAKILNLNNLLFIARDGYLLQKIYALFDNKIKNAYIYAPRLFNQTYSLTYNRHDAKQSTAIINFYKNKIPDFKKEAEELPCSNAQKNHQFLQKHKQILKSYVQQKFVNYKKYLNNHISSDDKCGIVDTITAEFSSQRLLQQTLPNQHIHGLYWGIIENQMQDIFPYTSFCTNYAAAHTDSKVFTKNWNFIEFLITSPEYSIKDLTDKGEPIYDQTPSLPEIKRAALYPQIAHQAVQFAMDIKARFNNLNIFLNSQLIIDWINLFIDYPSKEDIKYMTNIQISTDSAHSKYIPLFLNDFSWKNIIKNFKKIKQQISQNLWLTPKQRFFLCCCHPISIHTHGLRVIDIKILPNMSQQYGILKLKISPKCYYSLSIGRNE